jgi:protein-S-isoprenylcysteine O-methyltransferase Ste14
LTVTLNPWIAKATILLASIALVIIPHMVHVQRRSGKNRKGIETVCLAFVAVGFLVPFIWVATPFLTFADFDLRLVPYIAGVVCFVLGLWLLRQSHADLGTNWSITLELQDDHMLITSGVYRHVRHPMYAALLLYSAGQTLVVPNWIAGPSYLIALAMLVAFRLGPEERMMQKKFGAAYDAYASQTKRLVPGIW